MNCKSLPALPVLALLCNALIWGLIWWPLRALGALGWHPLWATLGVFLLVALLFALLRPAALPALCKSPLLWAVGLASGVTNGAFNWGVASGDVVRVILLFYLMPVWAVLLAHLILKEKITASALGRIGLTLAGALLVLRRADGGLPLPSSLADWLGVAGGMAFALTNVLLRRAAGEMHDARVLAMFLGGCILPGGLALALSWRGAIPGPGALDIQVVWLLLGLGCAMLAANLAQQYGAVRLPVNVSAVIMLSEVLFGAVSSSLVNASALTPAMLAGGAMILSASALSAFEARGRTASS